MERWHHRRIPSSRQHAPINDALEIVHNRELPLHDAQCCMCMCTFFAARCAMGSMALRDSAPALCAYAAPKRKLSSKHFCTPCTLVSDPLARRLKHCACESCSAADIRDTGSYRDEKFRCPKTGRSTTRAGATKVARAGVLLAIRRLMVSVVLILAEAVAGYRRLAR
jgi:hypothetical protein